MQDYSKLLSSEPAYKLISYVWRSHTWSQQIQSRYDFVATRHNPVYWLILQQEQFPDCSITIINVMPINKAQALKLMDVKAKLPEPAGIQYNAD